MMDYSPVISELGFIAFHGDGDHLHGYRRIPAWETPANDGKETENGNRRRGKGGVGVLTSVGNITLESTLTILKVRRTARVFATVLGYEKPLASHYLPRTRFSLEYILAKRTAGMIQCGLVATAWSYSTTRVLQHLVLFEGPTEYMGSKM